jgi:plastocyanin
VSGKNRLWIAVPLAAALAALGWAGFAPVSVPSRDELFEIPKGTYARRMAGDKVEILPSKVRLTVGLNDVLLLRNLDDVPQVFGPSIMMPGQSLSLPFEKAAEYQFACTAHASGQMTVLVEPYPAMPWSKIRWRIREWWENKSK